MWGPDMGSPRRKVRAWGTPCAGRGAWSQWILVPLHGWGASVSLPVNWTQWQCLCRPLRAAGCSAGAAAEELFRGYLSVEPLKSPDEWSTCQILCLITPCNLPNSLRMAPKLQSQTWRHSVSGTRPAQDHRG